MGRVTRLAPRGADHEGSLVRLKPRVAGGLGRFPERVGRDVAQVVVLRCPQRNSTGVEARRMGCQPFHAHRLAQTLREGPRRSAAVSAPPLPEGQPLSTAAGPQLLHELDGLRGRGGAFMQSEPKLVETHARDGRDPSPVEAEFQKGRLAPRASGALARGPLRETALTQESTRSKRLHADRFRLGFSLLNPKGFRPRARKRKKSKKKLARALGSIQSDHRSISNRSPSISNFNFL